MEEKLQEAISKLPVFVKAHINEPKIEDVAEISFKAGYKQRRLEENPLIEQGRKEVVEWIKEHSEIERCDPSTTAYFQDYRWLDEEGWQSQLKKWGL